MEFEIDDLEAQWNGLPAPAFQPHPDRWLPFVNQPMVRYNPVRGQIARIQQIGLNAVANMAPGVMNWGYHAAVGAVSALVGRGTKRKTDPYPQPEPQPGMR